MVVLLALGATAVPAARAGAGPARVVEEERVGPRTLDLTIASPALGTTAHALLLLPPDWSRLPHRRWPVLYLLHGALDARGYRSWASATDVEALSATHDVIVVMPDGGQAGWYSDWLNGGAGGPPRWETFHLKELAGILSRRYRASRARAIAGLSMGGLGATSYAARHPGMFRAVAAYSGGLYVHNDIGAVVVQGSLALAGSDPLALWGDPVQQADVWDAHDPYALAAKLVGTPLFVASGNGAPGPFDPPGAADDALEALALMASQVFADRVRALGGEVVTDFYGAGTHTWPYWQQELHRSFAMLMDAVGAAPVPLAARRGATAARP